MPINDIYEVSFVCFHIDQVGINHRWWIVDAVTGGDEPTEQEVADTISGLHAAAYKALLVASAVYSGLLQRIWPLGGPPGGTLQSTNGNGAGTATGDALPTQTSGIITLRTGMGGRRGKGRSYIPFPSENDNALFGEPTAGYMTRLQALADITDDLVVVTGGLGGTLTLSPCLFSPADLTIRRITVAQARGRWATQRRRGAYGRINVNPIT